ncbi:MAG: hypothetical protein ACOCRO_06140 [Halanaerobiales bacterium]
MNNIVVYIIIGLSAMSTIIVFAESLGFIPKKLSFWINKNRNAHILELLKEFGIDYEKYKRAIIASDIENEIQTVDELEDKVFKLLDCVKITEKVEIGQTESKTVDYYINLMGATTDNKIARRCARYLSSYWKRIIRDESKVQNVEFDFVITPKLGSPILGYEFSKIMSKKFILYTHTDKFHTSKDNVHKNIDVLGNLKKGEKGLIVDDSTTGGRKVREIVQILRKNKLEVSDCLVVFEPTVKNVNKRMAELNISLHSIVRIDGKEENT